MSSVTPSRKLAAILHADVVGYSRLMEQDEQGTLAMLTKYRNAMAGAIEGHRGRVVDMAGDSLMAEFPSVVDAVQCAVTLQRTLHTRNASLPEAKRVQFRMGIELADVILQGETLYGDGVNVAARLQSLADAGGLCVSDAVRRAVGKKLPVEFESIGEQPVKNISEPVKAYRVRFGDGMGAGRVREPVAAGPAVKLIRLGTAALVVIGIGVAIYMTRGVDGPPTVGDRPATPATSSSASAVIKSFAQRPALAVLPFDNISGSTDQDYFADGMTDDLITDLTKISGLLVISRESTFKYKNAAIDIRKIAQQLDVGYILHGSVRRAGKRVRINAQLTDARTGKQLWAERYDGELGDVFGVQDKVTQKIVAALSVTLTAGEKRNLARQDTENLEAYEYFLRGQEHFFRHSKSENQRAQELYRKAIDLDPKFARAWAALAWTYWFEFSNGWTDDPEKALDRAADVARKAIALDDSIPIAYFVTAVVYRERKQFDKAVVEAEKAISLDPNFANGRVLLASVLYYTGHPEEGLQRMREAIRLNPHHPHNYPFHLGQAYFILGDYQNAIKSFKEGVASNPTSQRLHLWLASAYAQAGQLDDAKWELQQVSILDPEFSLARIRGAYPFMYHADLKNFMDGLHKAGLVE